MRRIAPAFALLAALGCADDGGLSVTGSVQIEDAAGTTTGFDFVQRTNLVEEDLAHRDESLFAGHCRIGTDAEGLQVVSVGLTRPASGEGIQLERFRLRFPEAGDATVEATLGGSGFQGTAGASCLAELEYAQRGDGLVGADFDCTLEGGDAPVQATGELHFAGCTVDGDDD